MNTIEFVHRLDSSDIQSIVTRYFDELMVLYNLVGHRHDMEIRSDIDSSVATFSISMNTEDDAQKLYNNLNNTTFTVYNVKFLISMTLSGLSIETTISKAA